MSIKNWGESDRPREKLLDKGKSVLSNSELIAILMGSGNREDSAVELAKKVLASVDNNLHALYRLSIGDLMKFKGIGEAKAISIIAAMELGERQNVSNEFKSLKISQSRDVYNVFAPLLSHLQYEEIWCLYLNRSNIILGKLRIGEGGITGVVADPKKIFIKALELHATSIILCHNHPSGNLSASQPDKNLTSKVKDSGNLLDIALLDHIIIAGNNYISFADKGLM